MINQSLCIGLIIAACSLDPSRAFAPPTQLGAPAAATWHLSAGSFYDDPLPSTSAAASNGGSSSAPLKKKDLRTLQRFLEVECWKSPSIRNLERTLLGVSDACKQINRIVQRAQTDDLYGAAVDPVTGEWLFVSCAVVLMCRCFDVCTALWEAVCVDFCSFERDCRLLS